MVGWRDITTVLVWVGGDSLPLYRRLGGLTLSGGQLGWIVKSRTTQRHKNNMFCSTF